MKVTNMIGRSGKAVKNQFIIQMGTVKGFENGRSIMVDRCFQSYDSIIALRGVDVDTSGLVTYLDKATWNCSPTTSKYRNQFLGETKKDTQQKIDDGTYILTDLN